MSLFFRDDEVISVNSFSKVQEKRCAYIDMCLCMCVMKHVLQKMKDIWVCTVLLFYS